MRERKLKRAAALVAVMSADERRAMVAALEALRGLRGNVRHMEECIADIGFAVQRTKKRRESDARTDAKRRKLVGARLPLDEAARCARCAALEDVSLYRFVVRALGAACESAEKAAAQRLGVSDR